MRLFFVILFFPIWILIIFITFLLVYLEDGKSPFFLQERIGENGNNFHAIKFRTMVPNAEKVLEEALEKDENLRQEWNNHFKLKKDQNLHAALASFLSAKVMNAKPRASSSPYPMPCGRPSTFHG